MIYEEKKKLIAQAAKLTALGYEVEAARRKLRRMVAKKIPFDSDRMRAALEEFQTIDAQWKQFEQEHLAFRDTLY